MLKLVDNYVASHQWARIAIGAGLGLGISPITVPLTNITLNKLIGEATALKLRQSSSQPTFSLSLIPYLFLATVLPLQEESLYRGRLMDFLEKRMDPYLKRFFSKDIAKKITIVASIFFSSIAFGLWHFGNAILFRCHPIYCLRQVTHACFMGIILGIAKKCTPRSWESTEIQFGRLQLPVYMHISHNWKAIILDIR